MNNATSTKQNVNSGDRPRILATNDATGYHWHNYESSVPSGKAPGPHGHLGWDRRSVVGPPPHLDDAAPHSRRRLPKARDRG
jgi:hypothetical protein